MDPFIGIGISAVLIVGFTLLIRHFAKNDNITNWQEYTTSDETFARIQEHLSKGELRV